VSTDSCPGDVTTSSSTQPLLLATDPTGSHVSTDSCPGDVTTSSRTQPLLLLATGPTDRKPWTIPSEKKAPGTTARYDTK
jgi:hypothetical protein